MPKRALLFDVDGVLLDSYAAFRRIWDAWSDLRGLDRDLVWSRTHGRRPEDTFREVAPALDPIAERKVLRALAAEEGDVFPAAAGAVALLTALVGRPWALVTSGSRDTVHERFRRASLPLPTVQVYGEDVTRSKPDPECFLRAADLLGVEPAECVVIEDTPHGVEAGRAAGCTVVAVATTHTRADLGTADECFPSLVEAAPYLMAVLGDRTPP